MSYSWILFIMDIIKTYIDIIRCYVYVFNIEFLISENIYGNTCVPTALALPFLSQLRTMSFKLKSRLPNIQYKFTHKKTWVSEIKMT